MTAFTDPDRRASAGQAGYERCLAAFDVADTAAAYLDLYRAVC
jgi:hypothetical protein